MTELKLFDSSIQKNSLLLIQKIIAFPTGIIFAYLLINLVEISFNKRGFLPDFLVIGFILFFLLIFIIIAIWYYSKGLISIYGKNNGNIKIIIDFQGKDTYIIDGIIDGEIVYKRTYAKYGMYHKDLWLTIKLNNRPYCVIRERLSALKRDPIGIPRVDEFTKTDEPIFWAKGLLEMNTIIHKYTKE